MTGSHTCNTASIFYKQNQLIALMLLTLLTSEWPTVPEELRRRWWGSRAGVKWSRKSSKFKPCIPAVITGNLRSLANKMDELEVLSRKHGYMSRYRIPTPPSPASTWSESTEITMWAARKMEENEPPPSERASALENILPRSSAWKRTSCGTGWLQPNCTDLSHHECHKEASSSNLRPIVCPSQNPLQFAYQLHVGLMMRTI